jgi:hypothetical protein
MGERLKVILGAVNTYLVLAGVVITIVAGEVTPLLDNETAEVAARLVATALAWLGAATAIIRRSTEVPIDERGVLPQNHYIDLPG